ncbi:hypothetical protein CDIK_1436 [Cucumispora dikerogammari]|nr:hypothetical protein CDIK_1436 [Cucumispora dikerogammari]
MLPSYTNDQNISKKNVNNSVSFYKNHETTNNSYEREDALSRKRIKLKSVIATKTKIQSNKHTVNNTNNHKPTIDLLHTPSHIISEFVTEETDEIWLKKKISDFYERYRKCLIIKQNFNIRERNIFSTTKRKLLKE